MIDKDSNLRLNGDELCYDRFKIALVELQNETPPHLLSKISHSAIVERAMGKNNFPCYFSAKTFSNKVYREKGKRVAKRKGEC